MNAATKLTAAAQVRSAETSAALAEPGCRHLVGPLTAYAPYGARWIYTCTAANGHVETYSAFTPTDGARVRATFTRLGWHVACEVRAVFS